MSPTRPRTYPFVALVGQDRLRTALLLNLVSPEIGGVLIVGERGTAKSTAARGLTELAPAITTMLGCPFRCEPGHAQDCCEACQGASEQEIVEMASPFVHLPIGATEDRLLGSLDLDRVLQKGERALQPGLLASAHRGVLYIDEVNLLADHLVDALLDASASGQVTIERDGVTASHASRFVLVGSMNPDEGRLRPQLLDRFGLTVEVAAPREPGPRSEIVRRRLAFDADPVGFCRQWEQEQYALRDRIVTARQRRSAIATDDAILGVIAGICAEAGVEGLRADITMLRAAQAFAAWSGDESVTEAHVDAVKEMVLEHRRREPPNRRPSSSNPPPNHEQPPSDRERSPTSPPPPPGDESSSESSSTPNATAPREQVFAPRQASAKLPEVPPVASVRSASADARGDRQPKHGRGEVVRSVPDPKPRELDLQASVRNALERGAVQSGLPQLDRSDLKSRERDRRTQRLIVFVVDASGSMGARRRMELVKGAVLALLDQTRTARDEVALIAFRGTEAELVLAPCRDAREAERQMRSLTTGGRTPLAHALAEASSLIERHLGEGGRSASLLVLSDGRANVALGDPAGDPWRQSLEQAKRLAEQLAGIGGVARVYDTEEGFVKLGRTQELASTLGADLEPIARLTELAPVAT
ncbi:Magnesium-chelatase 38 kDa subunit [Planctomycetes bacterium Pan216]|uniref:Mg-protoporphyrin IX chelatase n=1 Tax=Kolteria novifilia TaxID=2527975 RepID=A0A518B8N6_9BACT|nr:Magnesium-chelatase 38 kDa subunit [Planctomycetes bacterium Pan216]